LTVKPDFSELLIAVIDDNRFMRHVVAEILRKLEVGCVIEAENATAAFDRLAMVQADVIFCDWVMRPLTGIEFLRKVRAGETRIDRDTPIIMMTSQIEAAQVLEARAAGISGYIAKPITLKAVTNQLTAVVAGLAATRAARA
jgi:two-component system chemotaxis response regulator CheY